jgi:hypothetical protein
MKNNIVRMLLSLVILSVLVGATNIPYTSTAHAGSNGQQVYFSCPNTSYGWPQMDYAVIRGNNQNNQSVTWQGYAARTSSSTYVFTSNWWWVGNIRIYWWNAHSNSWDSEVYYVPRQQNGNVSYFTCPRGIW